MRRLSLIGIAVLVTAGCGSSSKPHGVAFDSGLKFASCMRSHGVPNFPDPSPGGGLKIAPGSGLNPQSPSFQAAQKACQRFQPLGPAAFPKMSAAQKRQALHFAQCMRSQGEPNFPDPGFSPPKGATAILALRGMFFAFGPGQQLEPKSPAFQRAIKACGLRPPPGAS
jgi:hypothetical protein